MVRVGKKGVVISQGQLCEVLDQIRPNSGLECNKPQAALDKWHPVHDLDHLKWAVCDKFRDYLYYVPTFTVYTDNNPLTYLQSTARLNAMGHRWVGELGDFCSDIK